MSSQCVHDFVPSTSATAYSEQQLMVAAEMCRALSDPSRLRLLLLLSEREMCVSELVEHEQGKLSSISARLQMLYNARLLSRHREAKHIYYSLADEHIRNLLQNILEHAVESNVHSLT